MKNDETRQAESVLSDDELRCVTGGTSLYSGVLKAAQRSVGPVWVASDEFLFGVESDYPRRAFSQPR